MKFALVLVALVVVSAPAIGQAAGTKRSESDNCTWFPDGNYADCCVEHDKEYSIGGSLKERNASDKKLRRCVLSKGTGWKRKLLADVMYLGVRIGGVHFLPTPFRWGFGNKWPRMRPPRRTVKQLSH